MPSADDAADWLQLTHHRLPVDTDVARSLAALYFYVYSAAPFHAGLAETIRFTSLLTSSAWSGDPFAIEASDRRGGRPVALVIGARQEIGPWAAARRTVAEAFPAYAIETTPQILEILVLDQHRLRGIGRRLIRSALDTLGAEQVWLTTPSHAGAVGFYDHLGATRIGSCELDGGQSHVFMVLRDSG